MKLQNWTTLSSSSTETLMCEVDKLTLPDPIFGLMRVRFLDAAMPTLLHPGPICSQQYNADRTTLTGTGRVEGNVAMETQQTVSQLTSSLELPLARGWGMFACHL